MEEICIAILVSTLVQRSCTYPNSAVINISRVNLTPNESSYTIQMKKHLNGQKRNKKGYIGASNLGVNIPNNQERKLSRNHKMMESKRGTESYSRTIADFAAAKGSTIAHSSAYLYATSSINGIATSVNLKDTCLTYSTSNASEAKTYEINSSYFSVQAISISPSPPFLAIKYTVYSTMTNSGKTTSINLGKVHNFTNKLSSTNYPVVSMTFINSSFISQKEVLTSSSQPHIINTIATSRAREVVTTAQSTNTVGLDKGHNFTGSPSRMSFPVSSIAFIGSRIKTVEMILASTLSSLMTEFLHIMNGTATTLDAGMATTTYRTSKVEKRHNSTFFPLRTSYPVSSVAYANSSLVTSKFVLMSISPITTECLHSNNTTTTIRGLRVVTTPQRTNTISLEKRHNFTQSPLGTGYPVSSTAFTNSSFLTVKTELFSSILSLTTDYLHIMNSTVATLASGVGTTVHRTNTISLEKRHNFTLSPLRISYPVSSTALINSSFLTVKMELISSILSLTTDYLHIMNATVTTLASGVETTVHRKKTISLEKKHYFTNSPSQTSYPASSVPQVNSSMITVKNISTSIPRTITNSLFHITKATAGSIKHSVLSVKNSSQSQLFTTTICSSTYSALTRSVDETLRSALPPTTSSPVTIALSSPSFLLPGTNSVLSHTSTLTEAVTSKLSTSIIAAKTTSFFQVQEFSTSSQTSSIQPRSSITSQSIILCTETKSAPSSMITIKRSSELSHITVVRTSVIPSTTVVPKTTILPKVVKVVANAQLSLNEKFLDELMDKNSDEYKEMSLKTKKALRDIYISLVGFQDVFILGFKSGSIGVIYQIIFQKSEETSNLDLMKKMLKNATEHAISEGTLGKYRVLKGSFKIHSVFIPYEEEKVNRHPYWFIYASLGLLLLLILVVVCFVKQRRKRSRREFYGMFNNEAYDAVEMNDKDERQGHIKIPEMYGKESVSTENTDDAETRTKVDNPENRDIDMTSFH